MDVEFSERRVLRLVPYPPPSNGFRLCTFQVSVPKIKNVGCFRKTNMRSSLRYERLTINIIGELACRRYVRAFGRVVTRVRFGANTSAIHAYCWRYACIISRMRLRTEKP